MATLVEISRELPRPGAVWGLQPQRDADDAAPPWRRPRLGTAAGRCRRVADDAGRRVAGWSVLDDTARRERLRALRAALRRDGLRADHVADAIAAAAATAAATTGRTPRPTQCRAAAALVDARMVEMATGEGKTLAIAIAAAVLALAGVPVHVATANDYLAARDAAAMTPLYAALGVGVATLAGIAAGADGDAARRAAYRCDVVYATAKALAFDHLRDRQAAGGAGAAARIAAEVAGAAPAPPLTNGLCCALLDEADSILLDEAEVPLILSREAPHAARRAFLWQAVAIARQLVAGRDFDVAAADRRATLTGAGDERIAAIAAGLDGPWQRPRYRREAVQTALVALHALHRDADYVVRDGRVELLDEVTGRIAPGRVWSRGLHTAVALKEGLKPAEETETVAQTTFQRFFQRYRRLAGISGTLREASAELREVYGATVVTIPLHRPSRRIDLPPRRYADADALFDAAAVRVAELRAAGRPVLVGTDGVADSAALSRRLAAAGIPHRVLDALADADEAAIVAGAGRAGAVTVATRMAGRGTDIDCDADALAAGGLHVLSCQHNPSRRLDRQLAGRAARHGDPGSAEAWSFDRCSPHRRVAPPPIVPAGTHAPLTGVPSCITTFVRRWPQRREERRRALLRRELLRQDLHWERRLAFAGTAA